MNTPSTKNLTPRSASLPDLSPAQDVVLSYFRKFILENGFSPTLREAASALGVTHVTVNQHVEALIAKGRLCKSERWGARGVTLATRKNERTAEPLTPRQFEVLNFICTYVSAHNQSPRLKEIAKSLGVSVVSIHEIVRVLVEKGYLAKAAKARRGLTVLHAPAQTAAAEVSDD